MNAAKMLFKIATLLLLLVISSCEKDKSSNPTSETKFYRLKSYEIGVVPKQRTVQILFQVTDYLKKGVTNLTAADFEVSENNGRIDTEAQIRLSRSSLPYVLKNVLLLDISKSVEGFVPQIKAAAIALIDKKLDNQEIAIFTFDSGITQIKAFSKNKTELKAAINSIPENNLVNSTNLYGAIRTVATLWQDAYSINGIVDGSLIIFTDGRHNASSTNTLNTAKTALGTKRVYVAALASPDLDEQALQSLAGTSDRYFKANDFSKLQQMFVSIQDEIQGLANSIYFLYYQSPISDPIPYVNKLKVEIKGNMNTGIDRQIIESFNSAGFGN
jgi:uncharacterized protein YegL